MNRLQELLKTRILVLDGATGTEIQKLKPPVEAWESLEGCNEVLNVGAPELIERIHNAYAMAGADIIKTNTFGCLPWVLDEYGISSRTRELTIAGVKLAKSACERYSTPEKPRFVAASLGPGTKLPSLGHIKYDEMYDGYLIAAKAASDAGADLFLLETCQDPLQIKAALHACQDAAPDLPIMVSATIELNGTMLIGTDAATLAVILEPFNILTLGFNCGTGPQEVQRHLHDLSQVYGGRISVHANAGLPQNRGGFTFYPMGPDEFASHGEKFAKMSGVSIIGGCCGTTPQHIQALARVVESVSVSPSVGQMERSIASLFGFAPLVQTPAPFYIGERSNATGSKAFRELLLAEDYEGTLAVGQEQVRAGAHGLDLSVAFAGRDERADMQILSALYSQKIALPLMPDSTQIGALETALKNIGGRAIVNSVNLEDGEEKFDKVCSLVRKFGAALVCLVIDEQGMAKTKERKLEVAERIYERATKLHGFDGGDLVFDMLTFTLGSGDEEYFTAGVDTIEAIKQFSYAHPEVGFVLGVSNISFGLAKHAREVLNSVFLHHCVQAGLSMAIVNVKLTLPLHKISAEDRLICEDLIFNRRENGDPLHRFIAHFSHSVGQTQEQSDDELEKLDMKGKIAKLLIDGDKQRLLALLPEAREQIAAEKIINEHLIGAMKAVGELFGSGQMQLPFVLQSAETMKAAVDALQPYLPKTEKKSQTTLILGTVKGDVHDVGKNLVDIILSNNGFKVVNIGIKADIEAFVHAYSEHGGFDGNRVALGMSGLLVKSTQVMKENLEELSRLGVESAVLLGGAALNREFIDTQCRTVYSGPIFYCRDAFDGIEAMKKVELNDFSAIEVEESSCSVAVETPQLVVIDPAAIVMPSVIEPAKPPFWGREIWCLGEDEKKLAFEWLNHRMVFKERWGYKSKGMEKAAYEKQLEEVVKPAYERLKEQFLSEELFEPTVIYGYWPCRADDNRLLIFDESEGLNTEPLENVRDRAIKVFEFPRQSKRPHRALSDFFRSDVHDCVAMSVVSAGPKLSEYEKELFAQGRYHEYYLVHGLGVELAEALAEMIHKRVRAELGILRNESSDLNEVKMTGYTGQRYSFGYPACPDLELNRPLFDLLRPEEFGIELSETFQIHPEQSTSALIVHHGEAQYYAV